MSIQPGWSGHTARIMSYMLVGIIYYDYNCSVIFVAFACRLTILAQMLCLQLCFRTKISLVLVHYLVSALFSASLAVCWTSL